jgi:hypothetical protein
MIYYSTVVQAADPIACALFIVLHFGLAGLIHSLWLRSPLSLRFAKPIDCGKMFLGKRVFGDNKTWRGLMVLPLAAMILFSVSSLLRSYYTPWMARGMWELSTIQYAFLGFVGGTALMLAELPNSFFKRQLNVAPGQAPKTTLLAIFCAILDRIDSVLGALIVLNLFIPIAVTTWLWCLVFGCIVHYLLNTFLFYCKIKKRAL